MKILLVLFILFFNTSCIYKSINQKGYVFDKNDLEKINIGLTNKENVLKILSFPSMKSYFNEDIWFYYTYKSKEFLFFKPFISEQKIIILEFDTETEILKDLALYDIKSNKFNILETDEKYEKDKQNVIKDILSNIGQVGF